MREATLWRLKHYGTWIAACIAVTVAYFHGFELISLFVHSQDSIHIAANVYVVVFAALIVILAAWRQWITIRKERYANITPLIHGLFHQVRDLTTHMTRNEPKDGSKREYEEFLKNCREIIGLILDQLNGIFLSITSTHCRTAIKLQYSKNGKTYLYAIARDHDSKRVCLQMDNKRFEEDHDELVKNPHYDILFDENENKWHFFSNNLTSEENFRSTSLTAYDKDFATRPRQRRWWEPWKDSWPLPYKSKIACVIRQPPFDFGQCAKSEIHGLLIVDSESRGVFVERWDVQLVFAVADALYGPIHLYLMVEERARQVA